MNERSRFSVNNTQVSSVLSGGQRLLQKTLGSNVSLPLTSEDLAEILLEYQSLLTQAGVRIPEMFSLSIEDRHLVMLCEDGGVNVVDQYPTLRSLLSSTTNMISGIVDVLRKATSAGVSIDPHIKNFVGDEGNLFYVDLSPPLIERYVAARLSVAGGVDEYQIRHDNFSYFEPRYFPYHFAGDFLAIDPVAESGFPELHSLLSDEGLIGPVDLETFTNQAKSIRQLENLRQSKRIFLI